MDNKRAEVYSALKTDATLKAIINERVYWHYKKDGAVYPQVIYYLINSVPHYSFGNKEDITKLYYQIDAWDNTGSNSVGMEEAINDIMIGLGFQRTSGIDQYDSESKIYRTVMRYEGLF